MTTITFSVRICLSLSACVLLAGCQNFQKQNRVSRQDEAGSTHIAVLSVVPWDRYAETLQPTFKLTPDDALNQSIPNTVAIEEKLLNSFAGKLKVALPQTSVTATETLSQAAGQNPSRTSETTNKTQPGDLSSVSFGPSPLEGKSAAGLPPGTSVLGTPLGVDPILKYWVANALFQEVQLINQQIKNAAFDSDRYDAYLVRLQFSVMARMRDEPYDAYANVSFFVGDFDAGGTVTPPFNIANIANLLEENEKPSLDALSTRSDIIAKIKQEYVCCVGLVDEVITRLQELPLLMTGREEKARDGAVIQQIISRRCGSAKPVTPVIIPLLVTDDIQSALHSRSTEQLIQLGISLSGMFSGVGVAGEGEDFGGVDQAVDPTPRRREPVRPCRGRARTTCSRSTATSRPSRHGERRHNGRPGPLERGRRGGPLLTR